jgi:hypothetical protein
VPLSTTDIIIPHNKSLDKGLSVKGT